jgi:hypothetical protein
LARSTSSSAFSSDLADLFEIRPHRVRRRRHLGVLAGLTEGLRLLLVLPGEVRRVFGALSSFLVVRLNLYRRGDSGRLLEQDVDVLVSFECRDVRVGLSRTLSSHTIRSHAVGSHPVSGGGDVRLDRRGVLRRLRCRFAGPRRLRRGRRLLGPG